MQIVGLLQPQLSLQQQRPAEPGLGAAQPRDLDFPSLPWVPPGASALEVGLLELLASVVYLGVEGSTMAAPQPCLRPLTLVATKT